MSTFGSNSQGERLRAGATEVNSTSSPLNSANPTSPQGERSTSTPPLSSLVMSAIPLASCTAGSRNRCDSEPSAKSGCTVDDDSNDEHFVTVSSL